MGTVFELEKDKAAKGDGWAPPFISCAQDTVGLTPTAPTTIMLWEPLPLPFKIDKCVANDDNAKHHQNGSVFVD